MDVCGSLQQAELVATDLVPQAALLSNLLCSALQPGVRLLLAFQLLTQLLNKFSSELDVTAKQ